jgi:hypothetical protein
MNRFISSKFILRYFVIGVVFIVVFNLITTYYAYPNGSTPSPIDSRVFPGWHFFDSQYVVDAKESGYNIPHFFQSFFPIDLLFPIVYTLFFLSVLQLVGKKKIYPLLKLIVLTGCMFDYLENFSFAIFLKSEGNSPAQLVAGATTIKTILVIINFFTIALTLMLLLFKKIRTYLDM